GEVVVVEAEAQLPNDRPPLSKQVITGEWPLERARQPEASSVDDLALDLRLGRRAIHLDVPTRTLTLDDATTVAADAVVLACGSAAKRPPIPGIDRPGVHTLRNGADAAALRAGLAASPTRVLIVGAGFIGLEVASSARELELAVTVVEAFATPAGRILPAEVGAGLAKAAIAAGVDLRCEVAVEALLGTGYGPDGDGVDDAPVAAARLADGTVIEADLVLVAVGAAPSVGWLADTPGIDVNDGVVTDATCLAAPGIAVVGDAARWWHRRWEAFARVEHWDNAMEMGRYVGGRLLAGVAGDAEVEPYVPVPWLWSNQFGGKFQLAGQVRADDRLAWIDGTPEDGAWVGVTHDGTAVRSVIGYNRNPKVMRMRMMMDRPDGLPLGEAVHG
ncbi:MAG: FAD-dependent oxidoreductase, partial [Microthrixaceae bacterium]|nr:FAD-dependent oxidoreductase [Microthrixaceae bacterium]